MKNMYDIGQRQRWFKYLLKAILFHSKSSANVSCSLFQLVKVVIFVIKRTFCKKRGPFKKKGQNVPFRELKNEKGRVGSPVYVIFIEISTCKHQRLNKNRTIVSPLGNLYHIFNLSFEKLQTFPATQVGLEARHLRTIHISL